MTNGTSIPKVPVGMVLDYSDTGGDTTDRVRVKGFRSPERGGPKRRRGLVYLVPAEGDIHDEDRLPEELRDISVASFWELVEAGKLQVVDSPE